MSENEYGNNMHTALTVRVLHIPAVWAPAVRAQSSATCTYEQGNIYVYGSLTRAPGWQ